MVEIIILRVPDGAKVSKFKSKLGLSGVQVHHPFGSSNSLLALVLDNQTSPAIFELAFNSGLRPLNITSKQFRSLIKATAVNPGLQLTDVHFSSSGVNEVEIDAAITSILDNNNPGDLLTVIAGYEKVATRVIGLSWYVKSTNPSINGSKIKVSLWESGRIHVLYKEMDAFTFGTPFAHLISSEVGAFV